MTPRSDGNFLVWDTTSVDTFCESHKHKCASECGAAAAHAEGEKASKYSSLDQAYSVQSIAIETSGSVDPSTMSFLRDLSHRLKMTTGEPQSFAFYCKGCLWLSSLGMPSQCWAPLGPPLDLDFLLVVVIVVVVIYYTEWTFLLLLHS